MQTRTPCANAAGDRLRLQVRLRYSDKLLFVSQFLCGGPGPRSSRHDADLAQHFAKDNRQDRLRWFKTCLNELGEASKFATDHACNARKHRLRIGRWKLG